MSTIPLQSADTPAPPDPPKFRPRACARCSQSKLKCNWPSDPGGAPCERCARTNAECVLPSIKPRGPGRAKVSKGILESAAYANSHAKYSGRVGQLEQKLDGIMSLLTASQHIQQNSSPPAQPTPPLLAATAPNIIRDTLTPLPSNGHSPPYSHDQTRLIPSISDAQPHTTESRLLTLPPFEEIELLELIPGVRISYPHADQALHEYSTSLAACNPFLVLPPNISAYEFNQKQPFLFRTILQLTLPLSEQVQRQWKQWFREQIALEVIVRQNKSLEMLKAVLATLTWAELVGNYLESRTSLLCIATTLVNDLGLSRAPLHNSSSPMIRELTVAFNKATRVHSLDDMRTMLGYFVMSSLVATLYNRWQSLPYSAYVGHCCDALAEARQASSDLFLVALVRMQRMMLQLHTAFPNPEAEAMQNIPPFNALYMTLAITRTELDALAKSQPPEVEQNVLFWVIYRGNLIRIYEPIVYLKPGSPTTRDHVMTRQRIENLWNCLQSIIAFFEALRGLPLHMFLKLPSIIMAYFAFAIASATRILFLEDSDWDLSLARKTLDFAAIVSSMEEKFHAAVMSEMNENPELGVTGGDVNSSKPSSSGEAQRGMAIIFRDRLQWLRQWYTDKIRSEGEAVAAASKIVANGVEVAADDNLNMNDWVLDEAFWSGIFNMDPSWVGGDQSML